MEGIEVGTIVYSIKGRDSGRFFIVVEIVDDKYIKIADGELRRIEKPKLKQIKHVKTDGSSIPKLAVKLREGAKIFNAEIRSSLRSFNA
ncbi:MAG: KOW domain-containing RNA-binding protein [Clostridia bacterium]|nr:KOW domain-containing RNA-binding protein [Clostridia bacterium]